MPTKAFWFSIPMLAAAALAQWEPDVQATNYPGSGKTITAEPAASVDSFVYLVWDDSRDVSTHEIYFKRSTDDGATWLDDVRLSQDDYYWSAAGAVAAQGSDVYVVWHDLRYAPVHPTNEEIFLKRSTDCGASWLLEQRLTNDTSHSWHPRIGVAGAIVHVVWADYRTGLWQVFYRRSTDAGATWSEDRQLSQGTGIIEAPEVAVDGGGVHVVWQDSRHGTNNHEVYYISSTDDGATWGDETRLTNEFHESYCPVVSVCGPSIHVVWVDYRDSNSEVFYKHSTDEGATWSSDVNLSNTGTNPSLYTTLPSVAAAGRNVHVVWADNFDGNDEIYYTRSIDNGNTWLATERLTNDPRVSVSPVVMLTGYEVKVAWPDDRAGTNFELFYKRNPNGNGTAEERADVTDGLRIAPNPLNAGVARVLLGRPASLSVYDASGRQVIGPARLSGPAAELDLGGLAEGIYLVQARVGGRPLATKLVVTHR